MAETDNSALQIGVIGSGSMGSGIAQVAAQAGHVVYLFDKNPQALQRAREQLQSVLQRQVDKGRLQQAEAGEVLGRIRFVDSIYDCLPAGLVIEAIVEDLGIKRAVFEQLDDIVSPDCVLATNTSSLSIASIAAACNRPERVLGLHFFNPAPLMKLVEVIPAVQTGDDICRRALQWMRDWGKTPVLARDTPGFIVNRIARPFYGEALRILEEGQADVSTIDWAMTELGGFRMGPFTLMDFIGNDVNYKVTESVFQAFFYDPRYKPSFTQKRLSEAGFLGRKSGRGYYDYSDDGHLAPPNKDEALGKDIVWRILVMLINEAADALFWKIATRDDIELAMTQGVNYPKGLLAWADDKGIAHCVETLDRLYDEYREDRYRCSPLLRRMAREGKTFF
ncbi:MAG: NAD(P)-binding domain-containing protein [Saprospiraceae bacterium]|nr:NAD(P)-binding domain-containing protein [Saprospiraceae bacterium]